MFRCSVLWRMAQHRRMLIVRRLGKNMKGKRESERKVEREKGGKGGWRAHICLWLCSLERGEQPVA